MKIIIKYRGDKIELSPSNTMLKRSPRIPPKKKPKKNRGISIDNQPKRNFTRIS